jgi:phosphoserine phosphatase RsbU/P
VTLFYAELDTVTGAITYVNAGHNAPFLLRRGHAARRLDTTSMVLGVLEDTSFEARETQLESGDRLVLFTDGISEAFNQNEQEYGEERLESFLQNQTAMNEEGLVFGLISEVLAFCEPSRPTDDMTLMCISRL